MTYNYTNYAVHIKQTIVFNHGGYRRGYSARPCPNSQAGVPNELVP
jgi:hypothetical protein